MRNQVKTGGIVSLIAAAAVLSGDPVLVGNLFGVAQQSAAIDEPFELVTTGEFVLPKASAAVFSVGEEVYFDSATGECVEKAAGKHLVGVATVAAGNGAVSLQVRLNGVSTTVAA